MSFCMNSASARILTTGVAVEAVRDATFCLISGEASRRPWVSPLYRVPISDQLRKPRFAPPGGTRDTIMSPATPFHGGISASLLTGGTSFTRHCHWLFPLAVACTSGWFNQTDLYSQPAGS